MKRIGAFVFVLLVGTTGTLAALPAAAAPPTQHDTCTFRGRVDIFHPLNNQFSERNFRPEGTLSGCTDPQFPSATVSGVTDLTTRLTCTQLFTTTSVTATGKLKIDWQTPGGAVLRTRAGITLHIAAGKVGPVDITGRVNLGPFKRSTVSLHTTVRELGYEVVPTGLHSRGRPFGTCDTLEARNLASLLLADATFTIT
jgi:hypothetical protein